jgi:AraC family transcriptional regulator
MQAKSNHARLAPFLLRIQSRLDNPGDLASMARQFGASPFHFHRMFRDCIGETPRQYVERLRLERALLRLALTRQSILDISHAVGFQNHETFSRSFKRRYRLKPIEIRQIAESQQAKQLNLATRATSESCELSEMRIESLRSAYLLAKRRVGEYSTFDYAPFTKADRLWNTLVRWAARHGVRHAKTAWGLTYDIAGLTPPDMQRFDGCIRIDRAVAGSREIQCIRFDGGDYAVIDHAGHASTIVAAYAELADAISLEAQRYAWREGPSLTIYRSVHSGNNSLLNRTTVCFPIIRLAKSKKRQKLR